MAKDYLFTWKIDKWPIEKLRDLTNRFDGGETVTEPWRCLAHTMVKPGDAAYFLKQGKSPRGIFAVGTISGEPIQNHKAEFGENSWQVPITFRALVDPTKKLLVSEDQLLALSAPNYRWRSQASGISLESNAARELDKLIWDTFLVSDAADQDAFDPIDITDGRERINRTVTLRRGQRKFREKLLTCYDGRCAVTGCDVLDLLEAAHIIPFFGPNTNHVQNGLLLRSDIHTLFDCGLIAIDPTSKRLMIAPRLLSSSYRVLAGRSLRLPKNKHHHPSAAALDKHSKSTRLALT